MIDWSLQIFPTNLREHVDQSTKEDGRNHLHGQRYSPLPTVSSTGPGNVAAVTGPTGNDLTDGVEQLSQTGDLSSDTTMGDLGLEDGNDHAENADTDTRDEASGVEHADLDTGSLNDTTDQEDARGQQDGSSSTELVGETGEEGTEETSRREEGDDGTGGRGSRVFEEELDEVVRGDDLCDDGQVISEEEGPEGGKATTKELIHTGLHDCDLEMNR